MCVHTHTHTHTHTSKIFTLFLFIFDHNNKHINETDIHECLCDMVYSSMKNTSSNDKNDNVYNMKDQLLVSSKHHRFSSHVQTMHIDGYTTQPDKLSEIKKQNKRRSFQNWGVHTTILLLSLNEICALSWASLIPNTLVLGIHTKWWVPLALNALVFGIYISHRLLCPTLGIH